LTPIWRNPSLKRDILLAFATFLVLAGLGFHQVRDEYLLLKHSRKTVATVVSKYSGHGWIEFQYEVAGHIYQGKTPAVSLGKGFDQVAIGDRFVVRFDPTHPDVSGTAETKDAIISTIWFVFGIASVVTAIIFIRHLMRKWLGAT
jgi:hypothetical protein